MKFEKCNAFKGSEVSIQDEESSNPVPELNDTGEISKEPIRLNNTTVSASIICSETTQSVNVEGTAIFRNESSMSESLYHENKKVLDHTPTPSIRSSITSTPQKFNNN